MATATAPAKAPPTSALANLKTQLEQAKDKLAEVAPRYMSIERMTRLLVAACSRTPKILQCTPTSILQFAMKCAETGLEPIGAGGCWPIPYENKKAGTIELTFMPDYRGLVNCAKHAGCVKDAFAEAVYTGDLFDYELGLDPSLMHKPARGNRGDLEAAYCIIVFPDDTRRFVVMHGAEIESIRDRSQAWKAWLKWKKACPWNTDPGEMWKKTVIRRAMKPFVGMSAELTAALDADDEATGIDFSEEREPVAMPKAIGETQVNGTHEANGHAKPANHSEPPNSSDAAADADHSGDANEMVTPDQIAALEKLAANQGTLHKWRKYLQELYGIAKPDASLLTAEQAAAEHERLEGILNGAEA